MEEAGVEVFLRSSILEFAIGDTVEEWKIRVLIFIGGSFSTIRLGLVNGEELETPQFNPYSNSTKNGASFHADLNPTSIAGVTARDVRTNGVRMSSTAVRELKLSSHRGSITVACYLPPNNSRLMR